jgi:hypothetical protein
MATRYQRGNQKSVLWFTASDYPFGILWPLYCLSFDLRLLITPLVSCGHCIVCSAIYGFWLPLWYIVAIGLSGLRFPASVYSFSFGHCIDCPWDYGFCLHLFSWSLYWLFLRLRLLITPFLLGHCIDCPWDYGFWLDLFSWWLDFLSLGFSLVITPFFLGLCIVCPWA